MQVDRVMTLEQVSKDTATFDEELEGLLARILRDAPRIFDPFAGSGTTAVAAKELNRAFVGAKLEEEFAALAARRVRATERGGLLREIPEQFWATP